MKTLDNLLADFRRAREQMDRLDAKLPNIIGVEALKVIDKNFASESYDTGFGKTKWAPRSPATNKSYDKRSGVAGSVFNSSNKLLEQTGNLHDGIKKKVLGRTVWIGVNLTKVPYAKIHNEGGRIRIGITRRVLYFKKGGGFAKKGEHDYKKKKAVAAHSITMPQRQYMPKPGEKSNPAIMKASYRKLQFERDRIMRPFKK